MPEFELRLKAGCGISILLCIHIAMNFQRNIQIFKVIQRNVHECNV